MPNSSLSQQTSLINQNIISWVSFLNIQPPFLYPFLAPVPRQGRAPWEAEAGAGNWSLDEELQPASKRGFISVTEGPSQQLHWSCLPERRTGTPLLTRNLSATVQLFLEGQPSFGLLPEFLPFPDTSISLIRYKETLSHFEGWFVGNTSIWDSFNPLWGMSFTKC